jgi:hypothetical protein
MRLTVGSSCFSHVLVDFPHMAHVTYLTESAR